ncbi:hypothetical protein GCM10008170_26830 [Methylopila capsulata]|nr:hypothetical protein GCM10008170_26830 [Methylopila capsulata]
MTERWLILADDLTGAADCAIAFARRGVGAAVGWGGSWPDAAARPPVFAYDVGSRGVDAAEAARRHGELLMALDAPGQRLFKKIDSTLRGHPAAEIAAVSGHLAATAGGSLGVLAPAFPAAGRTTLDGHVLVAGRPLEEAEVWRREHSYDSANLPAVCATAGLAATVVPLAIVRAGGSALTAALDAVAAAGEGIAACDAETDEDLRRIAQAALALATPAFFSGSAGLAHALASLGEAGQIGAPGPQPTTRGALIVVGSLAAVSRAGARRLAASGAVVHAPVTPEALLRNPAARAAFGGRAAAALEAGQDVLVEIVMGDAPDLAIGAALVDALADALAPAADRMGAFVATGGETAAALLSRFGVNGIRLLDELEPGVAYGLALGRLVVPVVTKAGAFGDDGTLTRIAARLRAARTHGVPS